MVDLFDLAFRTKRPSGVRMCSASDTNLADAVPSLSRPNRSQVRNLCLVVPAVLLISGCARTGAYLKDRGMDFGDRVKLKIGGGLAPRHR